MPSPHERSSLFTNLFYLFLFRCLPLCPLMNEVNGWWKEPNSPEWHKGVLDARQAKVAEDNAEDLTIDEVKKRLCP